FLSRLPDWQTMAALLIALEAHIPQGDTGQAVNLARTLFENRVTFYERDRFKDLYILKNFSMSLIYIGLFEEASVVINEARRTGENDFRLVFRSRLMLELNYLMNWLCLERCDTLDLAAIETRLSNDLSLWEATFSQDEFRTMHIVRSLRFLSTRTRNFTKA